MSISDRPLGLVFSAYTAATGLLVIAAFVAMHYAVTSGPPLWVAIGVPAVMDAAIISVAVAGPLLGRSLDRPEA